ncbi:hypothetical protein SAMN05444411_102461 [Lutibacter oricola]|uniref:DUF4836 family protein n=1 Tax=Lutibacter oricola TaxID=762486 RepID=A0A1H2XI53_9FLAO|nr:hypothetical protein [Lutibacter oricola]SDW91939.1 hypothetical protein SAMN05444411_102461 [Lutibacter oricola]
MKKILLIAAIFTSFVSLAQNIESKIPNSAEAVVSINADRLVELVSISEFNNYNFSKQIFKEVNRKSDDGLTITSIKDFGFNVNSKAFYFYKKTDSISYHSVLVKLTDKNKFENLIPKRSKEKIVSEVTMNILAENGSILIWNDNLLFFSGYQKDANYFSENEDRFMAVTENENKSYYSVKKKITAKWAKKYAFDIFKGNGKKSILSNKNYTASKSKNAAASVWVRNYGQLINSAMSNMAGMSSLVGLQAKSNLYGFESVTANLYFEEKAARLTTKMEVSTEWQKVFKQFYKSKMDKNFYTYFNQNDVLAYFSLSMDMQAMLEEYPALVSSMYGAMMPNFKEEMELGTDFLSLIIDEEAIGELITGDMLFVLNDFTEKEMTYKSYKYDDNYKKKEVTKTKKEVAPDFTIMIGSKKGKLLNKAANLGIKHKLIENEEGYYKVNIPQSKMPFDLYAVVKNNILFFTTSKEKISNIVNNRFVNDLGKHQKMIKNNSSIFYVNAEKMISKVPASELSRKEQGYVNYAKDNLKDAYFKASKMKGNNIYSEIKINTSGAQENSLKTIFDFLEFVSN